MLELPDCRYKPPKPVTLTGVTCPECDQGEILERKGRFGPFYGCSRYPDCTRNFRARPVPEACPKCGTAYLLVRERKGGTLLRVRDRGLRLRRAWPTDLERYPLTHRGHRGGAPGRARRRDDEGRRQEDAAAQEGSSAAGGRRRLRLAHAEAAKPKPKAKAPRAKASTPSAPKKKSRK